MWLKEFWIWFNCFILSPWEQFTSGFPTPWHSIRLENSQTFSCCCLTCQSLSVSIMYNPNPSNPWQEGWCWWWMSWDSFPGTLQQSPFQINSAGALYHILLQGQYKWAGVTFWEISFVPPGNNIGLVGFFSLWKQQLPCAVTHRATASKTSFHFPFLLCLSGTRRNPCL